MKLYVIKKVDKQTYSVKVFSWILAMQLFNMKEFSELSENERIFTFKIPKDEEKVKNSGEKQFLSILKKHGLDIEMYLRT